MSTDTARRRNSTGIRIDPPTFSPPADMRAGYLERRRNEVDHLVEQAGAGEWKPVMVVMNHVRGTGVMYGFDAMGNAAENVVRAVQNGESNCLDLVRAYAEAVAESFV